MINSKPILISIVEDQLQIGRGLKNFLNQEEPYCCDNHYATASDALQGIISCKPEIVIMDIGLPDMSGVDCMTRILKTNPNIQFIMFTVFDEDELLFDALRKGASGYILKDDNFHDIKLAIEEVRNGGGPMSPSIAQKVIRSFTCSAKNQLLEDLTEHQKKILKLISDGLLNKEIAAELNIVEGTVKNQIRTIYQKLQVNNRVEASALFKDH